MTHTTTRRKVPRAAARRRRRRRGGAPRRRPLAMPTRTRRRSVTTALRVCARRRRSTRRGYCPTTCCCRCGACRAGRASLPRTRTRPGTSTWARSRRRCTPRTSTDALAAGRGTCRWCSLNVDTIKQKYTYTNVMVPERITTLPVL